MRYAPTGSARGLPSPGLRTRRVVAGRLTPRGLRLRQNGGTGQDRERPGQRRRCPQEGAGELEHPAKTRQREGQQPKSRSSRVQAGRHGRVQPPHRAPPRDGPLRCMDAGPRHGRLTCGESCSAEGALATVAALRCGPSGPPRGGTLGRWLPEHSSRDGPRARGICEAVRCPWLAHGRPTLLSVRAAPERPRPGTGSVPTDTYGTVRDDGERPGAAMPTRAVSRTPF